MSRQSIRLATGNAHKLAEVRRMLAPLGLTIWAPQAPPGTIEDGATFAANAIKKAVAAPPGPDAWVLADDSGLAVDALQGAPGVHSARYAAPGPAATQDARNRAKLLAALAGFAAPAQRQAAMLCVLALWDGERPPRLFHGRIAGHIAAAPRGDAGFGYDPLFIPAGEDKTFAELPPATKDRLSHRGVALRQLQASLAAELG